MNEAIDHAALRPCPCEGAEGVQRQACIGLRLAEVLRDHVRTLDLEERTARVRALEQLETLADSLVINAHALRGMANGKPYSAAMIAALEALVEA